MKKFQLGEFEEIVLLMIGIMGKEAYSLAIKMEIEKQLSRAVSMGALHTALVRLEEKGYAKSFAGEPTIERAGRPRRYFEMTALGKTALEYTRASREKLWKAFAKQPWNFGKA